MFCEVLTGTYAFYRETLFYISSSGGTFYQVYPLLIELSHHYRVCAYDRYGRGFSDDFTGGYLSNSSEYFIESKMDVNIALRELENVTKVSKEKGPFVLLG